MAKRRNSMMMSLLETPDDADDRRKHPLSVEAQAANLTEAWAHYQSEKRLGPGRFYRERHGFGIFRDDPVIMFVRYLDPQNTFDHLQMADFAERCVGNKVDCMVMRCGDVGEMLFFVYDSDRLEPLEEHDA